MAKDPGRFAILLQPGAGPVSERAIKLIREGLASDPRFVWTVASKHDEAPVADVNNPGLHVHGVSWRFDPPPRLVLSVGASNGTLRIAAREPGHDPLDGPTNGWLWVLSSPLTIWVGCL